MMNFSINDKYANSTIIKLLNQLNTSYIYISNATLSAVQTYLRDEENFEVIVCIEDIRYYYDSFWPYYTDEQVSDDREYFSNYEACLEVGITNALIDLKAWKNKQS